MPCDRRLQEMQAAQRRREEAARRKALAKIEEALAQGTARVVKMPNGAVRLVGAALPNGMKDVCVMAALQERNHPAFRRAVQQAQMQGTNFVHMHNAMHQK